MHDVVSSELLDRFEAHRADPAHREAVLITSDIPIDATSMTDAGLELRFVSSSGRIAAGTLDRAALDRVAQLGGITAIEADTEMHALNA